MVSKVINGTTYDSETSFAGFTYPDQLLALAGDLLEDTTQQMVATSATSYTLGAGSGTITMSAALPVKAGAFFILADTAAPTTNYALIQASADASGTSLSFTEIAYVGSGTKTSWSLSPSGMQGTAGALQGNATGTIDMNGFGITLDAVTLSGAITGGGQVATNVKFQQSSATVVTGNTGSSYTINLANGNVYALTLTDNCTFSFSNWPATGTFAAVLVELTQDGTGSRTVTWPAAVDWAVGVTPTMTATATTGRDAFVFYSRDGGTTITGCAIGQAFA